MRSKKLAPWVGVVTLLSGATMVGMPAAHAADGQDSTGVQPGTEVPEDTDNQGGAQPGTDVADEAPDTDDGDSTGVQPGTEVPEDTDNQGGAQPGIEAPGDAEDQGGVQPGTDVADDDQEPGGVQPGTDTPVEQPETPEPAPTEPSQPDTTAPTTPPVVEQPEQPDGADQSDDTGDTAAPTAPQQPEDTGQDDQSIGDDTAPATPPVVEQPHQPADKSEADRPRDNGAQPSAPAAPAAGGTSPASQEKPAPVKDSAKQGQSSDEVLGQIIAKAQAGNVSAEVTSTTYPYRTVTQAGVSVGAADYTLPVVSAGTYDPEAGTVSYGVGTPKPVEHKLTAPAATAAKAVHNATRDWTAPQLPTGTYTVGDDSLGASLEVS